MASLPAHPFLVNGGCFCKAITYTISVPAFEVRPLVPNPSNRPFGAQNDSTKRLPLIALDHCNSCRRIPGSIIECWFICLQSWTQFSLLLHDAKHAKSGVLETVNKTDERIAPPTLEILLPSTELEDKTYLKGFKSSEFANRVFCGRCGTHFTFCYTGGDDDEAKDWGPCFDMAMGTFEKESLEMEGMRPSRQCWWAEGIQWVKEMIEH